MISSIVRINVIGMQTIAGTHCLAVHNVPLAPLCYLGGSLYHKGHAL